MYNIFENILRFLFLAGILGIPLLFAQILIIFPMRRIHFPEKSLYLNLFYKVTYVVIIDLIIYSPFLLYKDRIAGFDRFTAAFINLAYILYFIYSVVLCILFCSPQLEGIFKKKGNNIKSDNEEHMQ